MPGEKNKVGLFVKFEVKSKKSNSNPSLKSNQRMSFKKSKFKFQIQTRAGKNAAIDGRHGDARGGTGGSLLRRGRLTV